MELLDFSPTASPKKKWSWGARGKIGELVLMKVC